MTVLVLFFVRLKVIYQWFNDLMTYRLMSLTQVMLASQRVTRDSV